MYLDTVVISGIIILVLTCLFLVVVAAMAWRHIRNDIPAEETPPPAPPKTH